MVAKLEMKGSNLSNIKYILHVFHNLFYLVLTIVIKPTHNQLHLYLHMSKFVSLCTLRELIPTIYGLRSRNQLAESRLKSGTGFIKLLCSPHTLLPKKISGQHELDLYLF